jgi:2-polyprenyl-3-methyl-5-hydroxy-6-metoxy-1,4-benzoquinol methylase
MHVALIGLLFLLQAGQPPQAAETSGEPKDLPAAQVNPTFGKLDPERWDRVYSDPVPIFNTAPNAFMTEVVKGLKPGRALEVGMGQGRNAIYLAKFGWDVTGFDISERGMEIARKSAEAAGVKVKTIKSSMEDFDYGAGRWDLIVGTYVGASWREKAVRGLKPGGVVVVEAFFKTGLEPSGAGFGLNELLRLFIDQNLRILRYEEVDTRPDWSQEDGRVVRLFAQKPD